MSKHCYFSYGFGISMFNSLGDDCTDVIMAIQRGVMRGPYRSTVSERVDSLATLMFRTL